MSNNKASNKSSVSIWFNNRATMNNNANITKTSQKCKNTQETNKKTWWAQKKLGSFHINKRFLFLSLSLHCATTA